MAQFLVDATGPADGAVGVSPSETIAFGFNKAIDLGTDWNTAFHPEPRDSVTIGDVLICLNLTGSCGGGGGAAKFVRFETEHRPNTDYIWVVDAVQSSSGESMTAPHVLHYTTKSTIGQRAVSGAVSGLAAKSASDFTPTHREALRTIIDRAEESGLGRPAFEAAKPPAPESLPPANASTIPMQTGKTSTAAKSATGYDYTRIYLLEAFTIEDSKWTIRGADVIAGSSGTYTVDYVRNGTYWPLAVRYTDADNAAIEAIGYHDADGDGEPDPITVEGHDRSSIDIALYEFPRATMQDHLSEAWSLAENVASDQKLMTVTAGAGKGPGGTAYSWTYQFFSPSRFEETVVTIDPLGRDVQSGPAPVYFLQMAPLPDAVIDSDEALQIVLADGGQEMVDRYDPENIVTSIEAGDLYWLVTPDDLHIAFWRTGITALTSTGSEHVERYIDMETGEILDPEALPVELTSFTAQADGNERILLRWETVSETDNAGFQVEHQEPGADGFEQVAFVEGQGATLQARRYQYRIADVAAGTHRFRLKQIDTDGAFTYSSEVEVRVALGSALTFEPPYPNPVRTRATLRFGVQESGPVRIELFDALGRHVRTLHASETEGGRMHEAHIEARGLTSGPYFLRLAGPNGNTRTRSVLIIR